MVSLQTLDCSANKLQALPAGFGHLAALASAGFASRARWLPSGLGGLKRLKDLDLRQNAPLVVHGSVPSELLLNTPLHRLELDEQLLDIDWLSEVSAAKALRRRIWFGARSASTRCCTQRIAAARFGLGSEVRLVFVVYGT